MSMRQRLDIAGLTDRGQVRTCNEDKIGWNAELGLAVLADGMGGHNAGEIASDMAVSSVLAEIGKAAAEVPLAQGTEEDDGTEAIYLSMNAIAQANAEIHQAALKHPHYSGMGTTLVMVLFGEGRVTVAHVGDSRVYRWRADELQQLTADHSAQQELVRGGFMTREDAERAIGRNVITRALGIAPEVNIDVQQQAVQDNDLFVLCSDGLSDCVPEAEVSLTLRSFGANLAMAARELVGMANARGGPDNVSVVLVRYGVKPNSSW